MKKLLIIILTLTILITPAYAFADEETVSETETVTEQQAETTTKAKASQKKTAKPAVKGKWITKRHYTYYVKGKKAVKGLQVIGKNTYYFDSKGRQKTGWQKIRGEYYFFNLQNGKKGYMLKGKTVNHIKLLKNGKAKKTSANSKRLKTLLLATEFVEKATLPDMKKSVKLRSCYDYMLKNYKYRGPLKFNKTKDWEVDHAYFMLTEMHGSCYHYGAAFAFVANACGYKECYAVSSGGHGWSQIDGKITDVSWERADKRNHYFHFDINLSGRNGRPNYKRYGTYFKRI